MPPQVLRNPEQTQEPSPEEGFTAALEDVVAIAEKLIQHCPTTESLVEVCKLGLSNASQLQFLMSLTMSKTRR